MFVQDQHKLNKAVTEMKKLIKPLGVRLFSDSADFSVILLKKSQVKINPIKYLDTFYKMSHL